MLSEGGKSLGNQVLEPLAARNNLITNYSQPTFRSRAQGLEAVGGLYKSSLFVLHPLRAFVFPNQAMRSSRLWCGAIDRR